MAAGFENTALMASCGAASPVPPNAREFGPIPIKLTPLVADTWELRPSPRAVRTSPVVFSFMVLLG